MYVCGLQKSWQRALDIVAESPEAVYQISGQRRTALHELCRVIRSPRSVLDSNGEFSDDEEEEEGEEVGDVQESKEMRERQAREEMEDNSKAIALAQSMIDASVALGLVKLHLPQITTDDEDENDEEEESQSIQETRLASSILDFPDNFGKTPLHFLCENSCDKSMLKVILGSTRENTGNPNTPTAIYLITAKDQNLSTPLHYMAFCRQCPFSSLQLMMGYCKPDFHTTPLGEKKFTDPTTEVDQDGDTPLHWALDGYVSPRRIKQLLRHSQSTISIANHAGKRPFDLFVANFVDEEWQQQNIIRQELWESIEAYLKVVCEMSDGVGMPNPSSEWLPLHALAGSKFDFPPVFLDVALHFRKKDLSQTDSRGMLPLHLACQRRDVHYFEEHMDDTDALRDPTTRPQHSSGKRRGVDKYRPCDGSMGGKILMTYPKAATQKVEKSHRLALHLAVRTQKPMPLIVSLVKYNPRSLNIPDPITRLWPFALASLDNDTVQSLTPSFTLLRADPSILHISIMKAEKMKRQQLQLLQQHSRNGLFQIDAAIDPDEDQSFRRIRRLTIRDD